MQKITWILFLLSITTSAQNLIITGVFDGPLRRGTPKVIELYVVQAISDLSTYGIGSATSGGGSNGVEFRLSGSANRGDYLYISKEEVGFKDYFNFSPNYISIVANINGDDAIELFQNVDDDKKGTLIDVFGAVDEDGSGTPWDYENGWAYRTLVPKEKTVRFEPNDWIFSGKNASVDTIKNNEASQPFPIATFGQTLGISDIENVHLNIFPNPVHGNSVYILGFTGTTLELTIYDMAGKPIFSKYIENNTLDISALQPGIYLLRFNQNGIRLTQRLVVL